jgi:hypothetical protein
VDEGVDGPGVELFYDEESNLVWEIEKCCHLVRWLMNQRGWMSGVEGMRTSFDGST